MSLLNAWLVEIGAVGERPRGWKIATNNTLSEVLETGYLNAAQTTYNFENTDFAAVVTTSGTYFLGITVANGQVSFSYNEDPSQTAANIFGGVTNAVLYQTAPSTTGFITPANNAVYVSNGSGVPSASTTLPDGIDLGTPSAGDLTNCDVPGGSITGVVGVENGGTGADLSATGGASQVLRQSTAGGVFTVSQLAQADISGLTTGSSPTFTGLTLSGLTESKLVGTGGSKQFLSLDYSQSSMPISMLQRDANSNSTTNNLILGQASTSTSGITTTLTAGSANTQIFTGSSTQTIVLPVTSTLALNFKFVIRNSSTNLITIQASDFSVIKIMESGTTAILECDNIVSSTSSSWRITYSYNNGSQVLPVTSYATSKLGVSLADGYSVTDNNSGVYSVPSATISTLGLMSPDNSTLNLSSPNGVTWTQSTAPVLFNVTAFANGIWVGGGNSSGGIWTSTNNAVSFTLTGPLMTSCNDVKFRNALWVACGTLGSGPVVYSTDAITWTNATGINSAITYNQLSYGAGVWICASSVGIYYSTNGQAWTQSSSASAIAFNKVYFANGIFVAASTSNGLYYSSDLGITWTQVTAGNTLTFVALTYANGLWMAGSQTNGTFSSPDGITWTQSASQNTLTFLCFAYSNTKSMWVAGTALNGAFYSINNGVTWVAVTGITNTYRVQGISYANGLFLAGTNVHGLYYSTDGINWTQSASASTNSFNSPIFANGIWVAPGPTTSTGMWYSGTGIVRVNPNLSLTSLVVSGATNPLVRSIYTGAQSTTSGGATQNVQDDGTAITSGNRLGSFSFLSVYDSSHTYVVGAAMRAFATQTWTSTAYGTQIQFLTTPNSSTTPTAALTLDQDQSATFSQTCAAVMFKPTPNPQTLSGTKTLVSTDPQCQYLNPNGSNRIVQLPTASTGMFFYIQNTGNAGNILTIQDASAVQVGNALSNGIGAGYQYDGSTWRIL